MKKTLLLLASAAMLLVGCAKEQIVDQKDGGMTQVTFTANLDNNVATKAVADGDGAAANVNRCIMEIYYGDELFTRQYAPVGSDKKATFTAQVVSNRTYKVAFWADCVGDATTDAGLAIDKYYTTTSLREIAIKGNYSGNDDARDAFYHVGQYTIAQAGSSFGDIKLKRPFAQMNVITTDWDKASSATGLAPEKVKVTLKNALVKFNAVTEEASGSENLEYEAAVYTAPAPVDPVSTTEKTLSMDYLFASKDKAVIDIDWKALHGTDANVEHSFAAVPYQRNFRTNIKGALLTTQGQWTVEVDPIWGLDPNGDFDYAYTAVYDIQGANDFVAQNKDKREISVTFSTQPNDAGNPSEGTPEHPINAIVTSLLKEGATYNIDVASTTDVLYVGDYDYNTTTTGTTYDYTVVLAETSEKTNAAAVNLVVTDNLYIGTLVVNSPSKSVSINGQTLESEHSYHIENLQVQEVSMNTVVIEKGMVVEKLEMIKGGLEIHGTVKKAIVPTEHGTIAVRDCENLDEELVYNVLKEYIADGYVGVKDRTTVGKWDIIPWVCKIGNTGYGSLADAVAAVQEGETITLVKDVENAAGIAINSGKTFTIDFGGHKYIVNKPGAGSTSTETAAFQLLKGQTITFKNGTIKAAEENLTEAVAPAKNIKRMFQSYANVNFENMTIDGTNLYGNNSVCEFACGAVNIKGTTSITTGKQGVAVINVDTWRDYYPAGAQVTISSTGEFGDVYLYAEETAAQYTKSSLAITDGKISKVYGDDSGDWTVSISGGVFSEKPDDRFAPRGSAFVANTDEITKAKYPWKVGPKPLPGSGTESDPYQIASAEDLSTIMKYSDQSTYFELTQDLVLVKEDLTFDGEYGGKAITERLYGTLDGGGHKITFPNDDEFYMICDKTYGGVIKNLDVEFKEDGAVIFQNYYGATFENVNVSGKLLYFSGNCGAYIIYNWDNLVMKNCICSVDITGTGGDKDYNAVFVGYDKCGQYGGSMTFKNCKYTGKMICGRSALFIGNPNVRSVTLNVENCSNDGSITSTYVSNEYVMNYYYSVTSNNYDHFILNGVDHPGVASNQSWVPKCWEDQLVTGTGTVVNGPINSGMAIAKNDGNQFAITPATGGQINGVDVAKYTVYSGLYVGLVHNSGSGRFFATEDIAPNGSASYTTTMKDLKFVDNAFVNGGNVETVGDNRIFTKDNISYYVVDSDYSTGGQPKPATIHYVAAYDAQGRLLASVSME